MKCKNGYRYCKSKYSTGKWLKRYFEKRTTRKFKSRNMKNNYYTLKLRLLDPNELKDGKMKDKYNSICLEDIDANQLFEDIKNELDLVLLHIDMLKAITNSDCITLNLHDAFQRIDKAFDIITVIGKNRAYVKLTNRFQERGEDNA